MKRTQAVILSVLTLASALQAQTMTLTVDSCRALAIRNNKTVHITDYQVEKAVHERRAAYTKYFPRINASGIYMYTSREFSLLSDDQKATLNGLGNAVGSMAPQLAAVAPQLNSVGAGLVDALHTDTRNATALTMMLTQPVYMGGKIVAYNRITRYAEQIARNQRNLNLQNTIVEVDEAYWQVVALQSQRKLAEGYLNLVRKLDSDVQQIIGEGLATKADGLSVKVKVNEAEVTMIQIDNGIALSKILLCQLCGLDINSSIRLADEDSICIAPPAPRQASVERALQLRPELNALSLATGIYHEKVKVARAEFLPTVALTGGYLATNPSVFNSFERKMKGMWNVGVAVNIPLVTSGERLHKVRAAKAEENIARLQLDEVREKVELQVNQCSRRLNEAAERMKVAERSRVEADENLRYATLGMKEGVIPVSNVLEAQTAWLKAHSASVTAHIDLMLADLYLQKASGTMPTYY